MIGRVKERIIELFHAMLVSGALASVWKWWLTCAGSESANLHSLMASSDVGVGRWRSSSLKQWQRDTNPESRSE